MAGGKAGLGAVGGFAQDRVLRVCLECVCVIADW